MVSPVHRGGSLVHRLGVLALHLFECTLYWFHDDQSLSDIGSGGIS